MPRALLVSKPLEAPWNDSSKNLVRDLAGALPAHDVVPTVLVREGGRSPSPSVAILEAYPRRSRGLPGLADQGMAFARLLARGARGRARRGHDLWHFFFAPNPRGSRAAEALARASGRPSVQTVCSEPPPGNPQPWLFGDRIVVLSARVERRLLDAGVAPSRLRRIPPPVPDLATPTEAQRLAARGRFQLPSAAPLVVYPGDLEFGRGAYLVLEAFARLHTEGAQLVMACRAKTARAREAERELRTKATELAPGRVHWVGETPAIHALLGAADVVALPTDTLYAKMDYPLAVLEAMRMSRAVVVAAHTAAAELAGPLGAAPAVEVSDIDIGELAALHEGRVGQGEGTGSIAASGAQRAADNMTERGGGG
ncbi:MAG: glycosyltransferase, partial [Myxococcota bacterium]